ncbi:MAG TPA: DUF6703 family protein [Phycicoccus sp.]|nr:DUF6703 family protein [Phycicoccus sp.]
MSSVRESFERASLPAIQWLNGLPRFVPFLVILALVVAGIFLPPPGWLLLGVVALLLLWILALAWPRLSVAERLMRVSVVAIIVAILVTQAIPRG